MVCLDPLPVAIDDARIEVGKALEGGRAEIKTAPRATRAAVDNGHLNGLAIVVGTNTAAAERIPVRIAVGSVGVEVLYSRTNVLGINHRRKGGETTYSRVEGSDKLVLTVPLATSTQAGVVPGELSVSPGRECLVGLSGGKSRGSAQKSGRGGEKEGDGVGEHLDGVVGLGVGMSLWFQRKAGGSLRKIGDQRGVKACWLEEEERVEVRKKSRVYILAK